jgi:excisionase family DNA binding protein
LTARASVKEPSLEHFVTTREVAEMYGVTQVEVQRAIKRGHLRAQKVGGYFYLIWEPSLPELFPR